MQTAQAWALASEALFAAHWCIVSYLDIRRFKANLLACIDSDRGESAMEMQNALSLAPGKALGPFERGVHQLSISRLV